MTLAEVVLARKQRTEGNYYEKYHWLLVNDSRKTSILHCAQMMEKKYVHQFDICCSIKPVRESRLTTVQKIAEKRASELSGL